MQLLVFLLGVLTGLFGYIGANFIVGPLLEYRKLVGRIGHKLTFYSHIIKSPGVNKRLADEGSEVLRDLACELESKYLVIPFRNIFTSTKLLIVQQDALDAKGEIMFLSNSLHDDNNKDNHDAWVKIYRLLKIPQFESLPTKSELLDKSLNAKDNK
ncbi:hypothetical protein KC951_00980 [Candidatus Saccharibacteria bacterium]|nr:hypothetical protein [Candidatus Saccharibacteria bacterium]